MSTVFSYPHYDPEFDAHSERIYMVHRNCQVCIDNESKEDCTVVKVDSVNKHGGVLLDMLHVLTDMNFQIIKSYISSDEYFIRHINGYALNTTSEKEQLIKFIEAAIERRVCESVKLELSADNSVGFLSDISRVLRENSLVIVRAFINLFSSLVFWRNFILMVSINGLR
ncbi:ACT domain protein, putative [Medicago truncatula]|uniref:ACT domain-containing protein ACR n=1 Tax=Medicago truncatula TaxID=3880 RepID=G7I727_MEDTR|nr:ACT domain protein, putative [Medicago truncatula]